MNIGEKIKELRNQRVMSQDKLAKMLNISFQSVSKWEKGLSEPSLETVVKVADIFGVSTDELLKPTENKEKIVAEFFNNINKNNFANFETLSKEIEAFYKKVFDEPKGDPIWELGARRVIKSAMLYLIKSKKQVTINNIKAELFLDKINENRQQDIIKKFAKEELEIVSNIALIADNPPQTFKSFMCVVMHLLDMLENM